MTNEEAKQAYTQAIQLFDEKKYEEALALLDAIDAERPNSRHIIYHRALCLMHLGHVNEAELCYRKLEGRMEPQKLKPLADAIAAAKDNTKAQITKEAPKNTGLDSQSENIFTVQAVYPVSTEECSVTGTVKKGVFHVDEIANVIGLPVNYSRRRSCALARRIRRCFWCGKGNRPYCYCVLNRTR